MGEDAGFTKKRKKYRWLFLELEHVLELVD